MRAVRIEPARTWKGCAEIGETGAGSRLCGARSDTEPEAGPAGVKSSSYAVTDRLNFAARSITNSASRKIVALTELN